MKAFEYVISLLNNLEDDIKTVINASVPNKAQNRAANKMAADYFWKARNDISANLPGEAND